MKTLEQIISEFKDKASKDDVAIVTKEDLLTVVHYLEQQCVTDSTKISLNCGRRVVPLDNSERRIP